MIYYDAADARPQKLLAIDAIAETLALSPKTIRAWISAGRIAHIKLGRAVRIPASEADRLIAEGLRKAKR